MPCSGVPVERVEDDLVDRLLAGEHRREQDAVVVRVRLGAEHGDVVQVGRDLQQLLERAHAGHAVADHHQLHLLHCGRPEGSGRSARVVVRSLQSQPAWTCTAPAGGGARHDQRARRRGLAARRRRSRRRPARRRRSRPRCDRRAAIWCARRRALAPDVVVCHDVAPDDDAVRRVRAARRRPRRARSSSSPTTRTRRRSSARSRRASTPTSSTAIRAAAAARRDPGRALALRARARLRAELADVTRRFDERKLVDRAKGILMRARQVSEEEAFAVLRAASMHSNQRVGQVSRQVIAAAHYADAVNRAGKLRMLSQRLVKAVRAARCSTAAAPRHADQIDDATRADRRQHRRPRQERVEADLRRPARRRRAPRGPQVQALAAPALAAGGLAALDAAAERLLLQADKLTRGLETAGLVTTLHVINVSGRQRMLSQRYAKEALLGLVARRRRRARGARRAGANRRDLRAGARPPARDPAQHAARSAPCSTTPSGCWQRRRGGGAPGRPGERRARPRRRERRPARDLRAAHRPLRAQHAGADGLRCEQGFAHVDAARAQKYHAAAATSRPRSTIGMTSSDSRPSSVAAAPQPFGSAPACVAEAGDAGHQHLADRSLAARRATRCARRRDRCGRPARRSRLRGAGARASRRASRSRSGARSACRAPTGRRARRLASPGTGHGTAKPRLMPTLTALSARRKRADLPRSSMNDRQARAPRPFPAGRCRAGSVVRREMNSKVSAVVP